MSQLCSKMVTFLFPVYFGGHFCYHCKGQRQINTFKISSEIFLLAVQRRYFFCGSFVCFFLVFVMLSRLFIAALSSPAGKGLTSWLLFVMSNCGFVTSPCGILGQVWYLKVLIPDIYRLSYCFYNLAKGLINY